MTASDSRSEVPQQVPMVILGGRDRRGPELPEGADRQPLRGYKGVLLEVGGRPLIQVLIDRLRATGAFHPIYIAGPRAVYERFLADGVELIETDGEFGENLRASIEASKVGGVLPEQIGFTTCDILPDPVELQAAADDLIAHLPLDFWMPQIRVPEETGRLGQSDWKPRYRLVPPGSGESVPILPGHLLVAAPGALRLDFVLDFLDILYRTRNRSVTYRRAVLTKAMLFGLIREDLKHLLSFQPPRILFDVVMTALYATRNLKAGKATAEELERQLRRVFIVWRHRRRFPERRGRVLVMDALSLAKDIDTVEEAHEVTDSDGAIEVSAGPASG